VRLLRDNNKNNEQFSMTIPYTTYKQLGDNIQLHDIKTKMIQQEKQIKQNKIEIK